MNQTEQRNALLLIIGLTIVISAFTIGIILIDKNADNKIKTIFNNNQFSQVFLASKAIYHQLDHFSADPKELAEQALPAYIRGIRSAGSIYALFNNYKSSHPDSIALIYFKAGDIPEFAFYSAKVEKNEIMKTALSWIAEDRKQLHSNSLNTPVYSGYTVFKGIPAAGVLSPVYVDGTYCGTIVSILSLRSSFSNFIDPLDTGQHNEIRIIDEKGQILYHHNNTLIGKNIFDTAGNNSPDHAVFYNAAISELSGKKYHRAADDSQNNKSNRMLSAWNSIQTGRHKLIIIISTPESVAEEGTISIRFPQTMWSILFIIAISLSAGIFVKLRQKDLLENTVKLKSMVDEKNIKLSAEEMRYQTIFEESPISLWEIDMSDAKIFIDKFIAHNTLSIDEAVKNSNSLALEFFDRIRIIDVNRTSLQMFGFSDKNNLMENVRKIIGQDIYQIFHKGILNFLNGDFTLETEASFTLDTGKRMYSRLFATVVPGYEKTWGRILVSLTNITDIKNSEEKLLISLSEKEILLRELYHRTKNNMQVICSMLTLQSTSSGNAELVSAFKQMENKIHSMALVHQKLYQSNNLSNINLKEYVNDIVHHVIQSYDIYSDKILTRLDLENIHVILDIAIPFGLILSELVSNSMKYAFAETNGGEISIILKKNNDDTIILLFSDNGVGVAPDFDFRTSGKMGMRSIIALTELQLQGKIEMHKGNGVAFKIEFSNLLYKDRM